MQKKLSKTSQIALILMHKGGSGSGFLLGKKALSPSPMGLKIGQSLTGLKIFFVDLCSKIK
jgi:hypothetical protein